jgi:RecA-family ATPase
MLEGNVVENTPGEWLRQIEDWVTAYPEERRSVANALADTSDRLREAGLHLNPLTWAMIGEPQPRRWLIDQWLPAGSVTLLTGEGGAGKSRLALQLAAGIAANRSSPEAWIEGEAAPRLGNAVPDGGTAVVYATWEDRADEMARRLSQISGTPAPWCQPSSLDNLKMLDLAGYGPLWTGATRYDAPSLTPLGRALRQVVEDVSAGLLILDSLAAVYGANENDRGQVRDFMASWDAWATAADCTVLIIGHPPKSAAGYSGSTDWHSAARARWEISKEPLQSASRNSRQEPTHWQLAMVKSNYGPEPPELCLDWDPSGPRWAVSSTWESAAGEAPDAAPVATNGNHRANYDDI